MALVRLVGKTYFFSSIGFLPGNFSTTERFTAKYVGAAAMYFISKRLKKKHNITDERAALYEAAETWMTALGGRRFLGQHLFDGELFKLPEVECVVILKPSPESNMLASLYMNLFLTDTVQPNSFAWSLLRSVQEVRSQT